MRESMTGSASLRRTGGSDAQTAVRLLFLLDRLGDTVAPDGLVPNAVKVVASMSKLQKLDFWLRNPDYLANELLTEIEEGRQPAALLDRVGAMLAGSQPVVHRYPMTRYRWGAYEPHDGGLAILKTVGHVATRRVGRVSPQARFDVYLLAAGAAAADEMRRNMPQLRWYDKQASFVALIGFGANGAALRARQYEQPEYAAAASGAQIPSILPRVRDRLAAMMANAGDK